MTQVSRITDSKDALEFMLAGNAYMTLRSERTGTRYTYRVKRAKDRPVYFVSSLYGSDNVTDYSYMGVIDNGVFRWTSKSQYLEKSPQYVAFDWAYRHLTEKGKVPDQLEVWHSGRCCRCGRSLTVPESIASGWGPECAGRRFSAEAA